MPARIDFEKKDVNYIVGEYRKGHGMLEIAEEYGTSVSVIRRLLLQAKETIRPRGRPSKN